MSVSADRPIERRAEDRLERARLAEALAAQVIAAPSEDGFVVGIGGPWGSGKTSLLNLVVEAVSARDDRVIFLRFNPWLFSSADELVLRFCAELATQLKEQGDADVDGVAEKLVDYGGVLGPLAKLPIVGRGFALADAGRELLQALGALPDRSAASRREQLASALSTLDRRVVVVVDDIDRLTDGEIRELVRVVKLVGDLPHVVYLLAYDRERVEGALGRDSDRGEGRVFLEKIVQVTHDIPAASPLVLRRLVDAGIEDLLGPEPPPRFDPRRWQRLYGDIVAGYLETVRDVRRYLNALPVTLDLVGTELAVEDVLVLEALRVFDYDVWEALPAASRSLTHMELFEELADCETPRAEIHELVENSEDHQAQVRALVRHLFPVGARYLTEEPATPDEVFYEQVPGWRATGRVAYRRGLIAYLARVLPEGSASAAVVDSVLAALNRNESIDELVAELSQLQLDDLLVRLHDRNHEFNADSAVHGCVALFELANRLEPRISDVYGLGSDFQLTRLVGAWFERIDDSSERQRAIREVFENAPTLSARFQMIRDFGTHTSGDGASGPAAGSAGSEDAETGEDERDASGQADGPPNGSTEDQPSVGLIDETTTAEFKSRLEADVLAASPGNLSGERRLADLVEVLLAAEPGPRRLRELVEDDAFLLALLRSQIRPWQRGSGSLALPWRRLGELVGGAERLRGRVEALVERRDALETDEWGLWTLDLAARYAAGEDLFDISPDLANAEG
jgi:hypothetical protein